MRSMRVTTRAVMRSQFNTYFTRAPVEYVTLGSKYKGVFKAFLFITSGTIGGSVYHFCNNPNDFKSIFNKFFRNRHEPIVPEETPMFIKEEIKTGNIPVNIPAKVVKNHLLVLGLQKADVKKILKEKAEKAEPLIVSDIIEEIIHTYQNAGRECEIYRNNKLRAIKTHETTVSTTTKDNNTTKLGVEETKINTKLTFADEKRSFIEDELSWHYSNLYLFSGFVGFTSLIAFGRHCHNQDFFMNPVIIFLLSPFVQRKTHRPKQIPTRRIFIRLFRATGVSVGAAMAVAVPFLALQMYFQPKAIKPELEKPRDFVDIVLPRSDKDLSTVVLSNTKFTMTSEEAVECLTTSVALKENPNVAQSRFSLGLFLVSTLHLLYPALLYVCFFFYSPSIGRLLKLKL